MNISKQSLIIFISLSFLIAIPFVAEAGTTDNWKLNSVNELKKDARFEGVVLTSDGYLKPGRRGKRIESKQIGIWSLAAGPDGTLYAGTGNRGIILRIRDGKAEEIFESEDQLLITDLIVNGDGTLYAGTVPGKKENVTNARVYRIDPDGETEIYAVLENSYIWDMEKDDDGNLYAASSPEGIVYRITGKNEVEKYFDTKQNHVLSLALSGKGNIYAGTAVNGILYRITGKKTGEVIYDFKEQELRGLAFDNGTLYVGANEMDRFQPQRFVQRLRRAIEKYKQGKTTEPAFEKLMRGAVYRVTPDGGVYPLYKFQDQYLTELAVDQNGHPILTTGDHGRVFRLNPNTRRFSFLFDFEDAQAQTMAFDREGRLAAIGTANPGSIYDLRGENEQPPVYTSPVLDAKFPAEFGNISWAAEGTGGIQIETRSGNTKNPDESWSDWSEPLDESVSEIKSPAARYLQYRIAWRNNSNLVVKWVNIPYLTRNQQPYFQEINVKKQNSEGGFSGKVKQKSSVEISWKAGDPDGDSLVYNVWARRVGKSNWFKISGDKPIAKTTVNWNTEYVQDGWYEVKVVASDELSNPPGRSRASEIKTANVLVDNNSPSIKNLVINNNSVVKGTATDPLSVVARIEYRLDDGFWHVVFPSDNLFDENEEEFQFSLPELNTGTYRLTVRVFDAAGNTIVRQESFTIKGN